MYDILMLHLWRGLHWYIVIFLNFYFVFFNINVFDENMIIYVLVYSLVMMHWYCGFCVLNLLELKHYDIDIYNTYKCDNHYMDCVIGKKNCFILSYIVVFFSIINLLLLFFVTKNFNKHLKWIFISSIISCSAYYLFRNEYFEQTTYENSLIVNSILNNQFI